MWITYTGASSFYNIVCFLILASRLHLDATITSEKILRRPVLMLQFLIGTAYVDASLVLEDFFGRSGIPLII